MNNVNSYLQAAIESSYPMRPLKETAQQQNDPWLARLHQYLDINLPQTELSNSQLAQVMELSERQFYRTLRKLTGYSPNQYLTKYRMKKATELLTSGQYHTVKEVAYLVGYKKDSYFSKQFKKEYKESPLEVLRRIGVR